MGYLEMIKLNIVAVGTLKERYWTEALGEYAKRLSRFASFKIIELPERRSIEEEGKEIMKKATGYTVAMDIDGEELSSTGFAEAIEKKLVEGVSEFSFLIGSSEGLSDEVKRFCRARISFGRVTYPHQLMRVILAEQLYRAMTINNNVPYHK